MYAEGEREGKTKKQANKPKTTRLPGTRLFLFSVQNPVGKYSKLVLIISPKHGYVTESKTFSS